MQGHQGQQRVLTDLTINTAFPHQKPVSDKGGKPFASMRADHGQAPEEAAAKRQRTDGNIGLGRAGSAAVDDLMGRPRPSLGLPPADFSNFNNQIRQGQTHAAEGPAGTSQPAGGAAGQRGLTTFADIASKGAQQGAGPVANERMNALAAINLTFSRRQPSGVLPTLASCSLSAAAGAAVAAGAGPGPATASASTTVVRCVPYDWSIKRKALLASPAPWDVFEAACRPSGAQASKVHAACSTQTFDGLTHEERVQASLLSWRFPDVSWEPSAVAALSAAGRGVASLVQQRQTAWRSALRSAYGAVRHGRSMALYVLPPQGVRNEFTVLFCARGFRGSLPSAADPSAAGGSGATVGGASSDDGPHAIVSQSTKLLRSRISQLGIGFSMPLAGGEGQQQGQGQQGAVVRDNTPSSALLFWGELQVHGLYDFLMNEAISVYQPSLDMDAVDVPPLLAPVAFEGAAMHQPLVKRHGAMLAASRAGPEGVKEEPTVGGTGAAAAAAGESSLTHMVELSGSLPPWTLHRLCQALQAGPRRDFTASLDSDASTISLNCECPQQPPQQPHHPQRPGSSHQHQRQQPGGGTTGPAEVHAAQGCGASEPGAAAAAAVLRRRTMRVVSSHAEGFLLQFSRS